MITLESCTLIIFTDRIRRMREGNVFSLSTPVGGGGGVTPARSRQGGIPQPGPAGGRYPTLSTPPGPGWGRGYPCQGYTPPWVPPIRPGWVVPLWGYPPCQTWLGVPLPGVPLPIRPGWCGVPLPGRYPPQVTDGVLNTPRSVCLLRSRRRTLLLVILFVGFHRGIHNGIYMEANEHVKDNQPSQSLIWDQQLGYSLHH